MKIIAASVIPASAETEKSLQIANDAELADIAATGDVLIDQLVQMARSGFTSAVLAEGIDPAAAERQFARYQAFYQGDALEPRPLFARDLARETTQEAA